MNDSEKIGFHKGALDCLIKERSELSRILSIVDALIQMHTKNLSDCGVDTKSIMDSAKNAGHGNEKGNSTAQQEDGFIDLDAAIAESKKRLEK